MVGRGASYSPEEDCALARCWAASSLVHDEQNATAFWESVSSSFSQQPEADQARSASSLRTRWGTLAKSVQKYLAAERLYLAKPVSGESPDEIAANIMRLFRSRTRSRDKTGAFKEGPPFRSLDAVEILRDLPKFGGVSTTVINNESSDMVAAGGDDAEVDQTQFLGPCAVEPCSLTQRGALPAKNISKSRPSGVKKAKRVAGATKAGGQDALRAIAIAMKEKNTMKKNELRFKYINALPDSEEKTKLLFQFLSPEDGSGSSTDDIPSTNV